MQTNDPMIAANQVARELNQPEGGKGARRLAEDLALADATREAIRADLCEQEAAARLAALPGAKWVYVSVNIGYSVPQIRGDSNALTYNAHVDVTGGPSLRESSQVGYLACVEAIEAKFAEAVKKANRESTIRARIEREMAEADAAEKALSSTAPLAFPADPALMFVPDGSVGDVLPIASIGPSGIGGYAQTEIKADTRGGGA